MFENANITTETQGSFITVSHLNNASNEQSIRDFFSYCGDISQLTLEKNAADETQSALIGFASEDSAHTATILDGASIDGYEIHVSAYRAHTPEQSEAKQQKVAPKQATSGIIAAMKARGYQLSDRVVNAAKELDQKYGLTSRLQNVSETFKSSASSVTDRIGLTTAEVASDAKESADATANKLADTKDVVTDNASDKVAHVKEAANEKADEIKEKAGQAWESVKDSAEESSEKAQSRLGNAKDFAQEKWEQTKDAAVNVKDAAQQKLSDIKDAVSSRVIGTKDAVQDKAEELKEEYKVDERVETVQESAQEKLDDVKEQSQSLRQSIVHAVTHPLETAKSAGHSAFESLQHARETIHDYKESATDKVKDLAHRTMETAPAKKVVEVTNIARQKVDDYTSDLGSIVTQKQEEESKSFATTEPAY